MPKPPSQRRRAKHPRAYKSGLEENIAAQLRKKGIEVAYETTHLGYTLSCKYTPDFVLPNGIVIESKGYFDAADRRKHIAVKAQHPEMDLRFVFSNSKKKLPKSQTTYAMWCDKHGFLYADKLIPEEWLNE
jgi:hypothetical protein